MKVVDGATAEDPGVPAVAIKVIYKQLRKSGKKTVRTRQIKSNDEGIAVFQHPIPEFVGSEQVRMELDLSEALEPLEEAPDALYELVEGLAQLARSKTLSFTFESKSMAAQIPTGVAVFDLDASGNAIALTDTAAGLMAKLNQAGFRVNSLPVAAGAISGIADAQVISLLQNNFSDRVKRTIFGTARITDHEQDGDFVIIQVSGSIKVVDLTSGGTLLTVNKSKRAQGTNASAALSAAFKKLGEDIGQAIVNELR